MRTLLWKDYRQNRALLAGASLFLAVPYLIVAVVVMIELAKDGGLSDARGLPAYIHMGSAWSWGITVALAAFFAGQSLAGERGDRSAEFIAYLPVSRRSALVSKAVVAIGSCLLMWLLSLVVHAASGALFDGPFGPSTDALALGTAAPALLIFGVAWLFSSFLRSAANSAACGLLSAIVLAGALVLIFEFLIVLDTQRAERWWIYSFVSLSVILGTAGFVGGVLLYLRRVEP